MRFKVLFLSLVVMVALVVFSGSTSAATYTVTNTNDSGNGSLRWAIEQGNANPGLDIVEFAIHGPGPQTIRPTSALPIIDDPLVIDGYTQPGAVQNTNPVGQGLNGVLQIELDGTNAGNNAMGLWIAATDCDVRGLVINRFDSNGIYMRSNDTVIAGNYIGTDITGQTALGNSVGVTILMGEFNCIGAALPEARNLISGNTLDGVVLGGGSYTPKGNVVQSNLIGTDVTGQNALGNGRFGIALAATADSTFIGGATAQGNVIAYNGDNGVCGMLGIRNAILSNSIHTNGDIGIDLNQDGVTPNDPGDGDTGPNTLQNFPVLTSANSTGTSITIDGSLNSTAATDFYIEFFSNVDCDISGYGEGETLLGSRWITTDGSGDASFSVTFMASIPADHSITATATAEDPNNNTSEFSQCCSVTVCCACADCNADGVVNILDALWEVNCILGKNPPPCSCDCNQDGKDNVLDALCIVNLVLGGVCP
jgi:hypothetical protein